MPKRPIISLALSLILLLSHHSISMAQETGEILDKVSRWEIKVRNRTKRLVESRGLSYPPGDVFIRIFKLEEELEIWARNAPSGPFILVETYRAFNLPLNYRRDRNQEPHKIGPKRKSGDDRVPEGVYKVLYHNPWSSYHLSLALSYPNPSDVIIGKHLGIITTRGERVALNRWRRNKSKIDSKLIRGIPSIWGNSLVKPLSNEILIHGKEVTIGCVPIGDKSIEEVFVITDARKVGGTQVHIFPFRFSDADNRELRRKIVRRDRSLAPF